MKIDGKTVKVNGQDLLFLAGFDWQINPGGFVFTWFMGKVVWLHRMLKPNSNHINGDPLDNRRENLQ